MYAKTLLVAAAVVGAASASPVVRRQVATESITATATVADESGPTPGITPTVTAGNPDGDDDGNSYPLYPCPPGFLLTYVQNNITVERPIGEVRAQVGNWATAAIFPNVTSTDDDGESSAGATHTFQALGAEFMEVLINSTADRNDGSAYLQWVWNSTAPVLAGDLEIATYSTVFKLYDPLFSELGYRSNQTFAQIFTNACAADQENGRETLQALQSLQLGQVEGNRVYDSTTGNNDSDGNDDDGNGGVLVSSVVATDTVSTTNTNTAIGIDTVLATSTDDVTQTNTLIPLTNTVTGTTLQETVTPATVSVTSTAATVESTAETVTVTSDPPNETATTVVATTTTAI